MPKFKIINLDQGHEYTHEVQAVDKESAIKSFSAWHYGKVIECKEIEEPIKCPHCGKEMSFSLVRKLS